jgi:hypothetical protein
MKEIYITKPMWDNIYIHNLTPPSNLRWSARDHLEVGHKIAEPPWRMRLGEEVRELIMGRDRMKL